MTTRCAFKIEDPSRGLGRVDFTAPDEGFGLDGTPKLKIQRDPSPQKRKPYMWAAAVGPMGQETQPETQGKRSKTAKPTETEGPCADLSGFCISALPPAPGGGPGAPN